MSADKDLLPGHFEENVTARARWVSSSTMSREDAVRAILGMVDLADEAAAEEALMVLGVNPVELFFWSGPPLSDPCGTVKS